MRSSGQPADVEFIRKQVADLDIALIVSDREAIVVGMALNSPIENEAAEDSCYSRMLRRRS